jgi:predicted histidine transporter YuiF (NhaC family)
MRRLFLILAIVFTVLALIFSVLPMDTLAFLPIGLGIAFGLLLLKKSEEKQKNIPKVLLLMAVLCSVYVLGKTLLIKDKVAKDTKFEQQKIENKKEDKKDLENLEKDLQ